MKRTLAYILCLLLMALPCVAELPQAPDDPYIDAQFFFDGAWLPDVDSTKIGPENFATLQNMRYTANGLQGIKGYSAINTFALVHAEDLTTYTETDTGSDRVSVVTNQIDVTGLLGGEVVYVVNDTGTTDLGTSEFKARFHYKSSADGYIFLCGVGSDGGTVIKSNTEYVGIRIFTSGSYDTYAFYDTGTLQTGASIAKSTDYYVEVSLDADAGTYGAITATFYSDTAFSTSVSTTTWNLQNSFTTGRYFYPMSAGTTAGTGWSGEISDVRFYVVGTGGLDIQSGIHFNRDNPAENHVLVQAGGKVYQNTTAIPDPGSFDGTALYSDASGAGDPRFSVAPYGTVAYTNGVESTIWGGDEIPVAAMITSTASVDHKTTDPKDYTEAVNNSLNDASNVAIIGGGNDSDVKLLLHVDVVTTGDISDSSAAAHGNATKNSGAVVTNDVPKFGLGAVSTPTGGDSISYADHADWDFGANPGSIDFWVKPVETTQVYYGSALSFNDNNPAADSIVYAGGSMSNRYSVGDTIRVTNTASNDGLYKIASFATAVYTDDTAVLESWCALTNEANVTGVIINPLRGLCGRYVNAGDVWNLYLSYYNATYGTIKLTLDIDGTLYEASYSTGDATTDGGYTHIAITDDSSNTTVYVNGNAPTAWDSTPGDIPDVGGAIHFGAVQRAASHTVDSTGMYFDEIRLTNGVERYSGEFTPPARAYSGDALTWLVASPRPLQGMKYYIGDANATASTMTVKEWQGSGWIELTVTDNTDTGAALAATGTVTWTATNEAEVKYIDGVYAYWYQCSIDAGEATVYQVTLDAPWQEITDLWDGVYRQPIQFQAYKTAVYEDYTLEVNDSDSTYFGDLGGLATGSDHLVVMFEDRMAALKWTLVAGKASDANAAVSVYYWDGNDWAQSGSVADLTVDDATGLKGLAQSGVISWTPPGIEQEFQQTLFGTTGYAYKLTWDANLGVECDVNVLTGIPAQIDIPPFKFPAIYKDRLFLCGYTKGAEGNRCDYSLTHAPQAFNGLETSMGGVQSLYFGGDEDLSCGAQLYNRMGSNIFIFFLALKDYETYVLTGDGPEDFKIFPVSMNVGCPAPDTLVTAEVGFEVASDVQRHVALWLSHTGPVIFDGAVIYQVPGIKSYFDPAHDNYVGAANIETAFAWFDHTHKEYNLRVGSYWFAYDLARKKWFEKDTGAAELPACAFSVKATNGVQYSYAGDDNGLMYRLEDGYSWNGTAITHTILTGDFWPTKSLWDVTNIDRFKFIGDLDDATGNTVITHYADGAASGTTVDTIPRITGTSQFYRDTSSENLKGWAHQFKFVSTSSDQAGTTDRRYAPLGWATRARLERKDQ